MSELPELGRGRRPGSPPRPEVLQAVVARGRQRLRRAALGGAGAVATVAAMAAGTALLSGGGGGDSLVVVPTSPPVAVPTTSPSAGPPPQVAATPGAPEPEASGARPMPTPQAADRPQSASSAGPVAGPAAGGSAGPRADPQRPLPEHRERPSDGAYTDLCQGSEVTWAPEGYRLCMEVRMPTSVPQYTAATVRLDLCSSLSSRGDLRLSFRTGREHEVQVRRSDEVDDHLWTWSSHHRFPEGAHQRELAPGRCLSWTTSWDTRDDRGQVLPPGEYAVEAGVDAEGASQRVMQPFRVTPDG